MEDHDLIRQLFEELNWTCPLELFETAERLLKKLEHSPTAPFIIVSDVNLPKMDGFELREKVLQMANKKFHSVPFIFWSTGASESQIQRGFK